MLSVLQLQARRQYTKNKAMNNDSLKASQVYHGHFDRCSAVGTAILLSGTETQGSHTHTVRACLEAAPLARRSPLRRLLGLLAYARRWTRRRRRFQLVNKALSRSVLSTCWGRARSGRIQLSLQARTQRVGSKALWIVMGRGRFRIFRTQGYAEHGVSTA